VESVFSVGTAIASMTMTAESSLVCTTHQDAETEIRRFLAGTDSAALR
jgi:hypothetical protein